MAPQVFDDTLALLTALGKSELRVACAESVLAPGVPSLSPASDPIDVSLLAAFMLPPTLAEIHLSPSSTKERYNIPIWRAGEARQSCPCQLSGAVASLCSPAPTLPEPSTQILEGLDVMGMSTTTAPLAPRLRPQKDPFDSAILPQLELDSEEGLCSALLPDEADQMVCVLNDLGIWEFSNSDPTDTPVLDKILWAEGTAVCPTVSDDEDSLSRTGEMLKDLYLRLT